MLLASDVNLIREKPSWAVMNYVQVERFLRSHLAQSVVLNDYQYAGVFSRKKPMDISPVTVRLHNLDRSARLEKAEASYTLWETVKSSSTTELKPEAGRKNG